MCGWKAMIIWMKKISNHQGNEKGQMVSAVLKRGVHRRCWRKAKCKRAPKLIWEAPTGSEEHQIQAEESWRGLRSAYTAEGRWKVRGCVLKSAEFIIESNIRTEVHRWELSAEWNWRPQIWDDECQREMKSAYPCGVAEQGCIKHPTNGWLIRTVASSVKFITGNK